VNYANRTLLDSLTLPSQIMGRENKAKELLRFLLGYKQGLVVPFVSVFGRSGSGKSTVVKFVCENLGEEVSYAFVNLRKAKTVFGCANLILAELGEPSLKSPQGMNLAIEKISDAIELRLRNSNEKNKKNDNNNNNKKKRKDKNKGSGDYDNSSGGGGVGEGSSGGGNKKKKLFILVLDEFDVLFFDKRGKPSDFIYKLVVMEEKLKEKGFLMCTIAICNNVIANYEIDDRVKSRIGTSEVFFEPYSRHDVMAILKDRASNVFSQPVDPKVLEYCASQSSDDYGDARRAIDLIRVAAEIASRTREYKISRSHVDAALKKLQKDRVSIMLSSAPFHLRAIAAAIARVTYLTEEVWHTTSGLYNQYRHIMGMGNAISSNSTNSSGGNTNPLTYRRVSELLTDLGNMGLVISQTGSKGRYGYGSEYRLVVPPEGIGKVCFRPDWWESIVSMKKEHNEEIKFRNIYKAPMIPNRKSSKLPEKFNINSNGLDINSTIDSMEDDDWNRFVGLE
jgi:archaeal cell division control protein 6